MVLKDPRDSATRAATERLLRELAADPRNGIEHILDRSEIAAMGGAANAEFAVDMKPGFTIGTGVDVVLESIKPGGTHGYSPTHPEMRAAFAIAGPGVRKGVNVGEIDMRSIAPTLAKLLGGSLPAAEQSALDVLVHIR